MQRERAAELDRHGADLMARMDQQGQSQRELQAKLQHEQEVGGLPAGRPGRCDEAEG